MEACRRRICLPGIAALSARLSQIGFERTRRALAALALSVFISIYLLVSLNAPEGFARVFVALAFCYGVAFFAVVAEWFWGRWFATGLAWSGVMIAIAGRGRGWLAAAAGDLRGAAPVRRRRPDGQEDGGPLRPAGGLARAVQDGRLRRRPAAEDRHPVGGVAAQLDHLGAGARRKRGWRRSGAGGARPGAVAGLRRPHSPAQLGRAGARAARARWWPRAVTVGRLASACHRGLRARIAGMSPDAGLFFAAQPDAGVRAAGGGGAPVRGRDRPVPARPA